MGERWNLYDEIWRSPIHGPTPHAPSLEAKPSKAGLVLGLAQSALGGAVQAGVFKAPDIGGELLKTTETGQKFTSKIDPTFGHEIRTFL